MGHLYDKRDNAIEHEVKKDETLSSIADEHKGKGDVPDDLDWKEIALFNWGTVVEAEVVRALAERVGLVDPEAVVKGGSPADSKLDPAFGPSTAKPILVPKLWKPKALEVNKQHTVKVRRRTPASAIGITKLDKWFIPGHETCDVDYATAGDPSLADAVAFEVHASQYGKLKAWKKGLPEMEPLPGVPVYTAEAEGGQIRDWYGLSKCSEGALSPDGHPLNVAFSPYTVLLRYAKKGEHADARIALDPFWVAFDGERAPIVESCKVSWKIENAKLAVGLLLIADREGKIVFAKGLDAGDLDGGVYEWDGKDASGAPVVPTKMPYRVQLQAHTDIDTEDGLAIAAMHTEVRLYVAAGTLPIKEDPYKPTSDVSSLDFSIADLYHKDDPPTDKEGVLWTKYKLAEAGFHPGPVTDATVTDDFKTALHELQRSVPTADSKKPDFARMTVEDDPTEADKALAKLDAERKRPWFGKPAEPSATIGFDFRPGNWDATDTSEFLDRLRDPTKRMIVWIDDRNWYTDGAYWQYGFYDTTVVVSAANLDVIHDAPENLGGNKTAGRGSFEHRDARVDRDARDIARPWIPLQVDFRLLGKGQELDAEVEPHTPEVLEKVQKAIGPLRVDWTFDEIEKTSTVASVTEDTNAVTHALPELDPECDALLSKLYHPTGARMKYTRPEGNRTRMAIRWALDKLKAEHTRKDVTRKSVYYNAPVAFGGIRPDSTDDYFKAAFGHGDEGSLFPWSAEPDDARQSICTAVHDLVGQKEDELFKKRVGRAGVYFHPSRIAGDGYQIRAQVRFDDKGPYVGPNASALAARYPGLPQAHTVQFRTWRKTTIRGYVQWAPTDDWSTAGASCFDHLPQTGPDEWRAHYTACHVSIENELGAKNDELKLRPSALFASDDDYFDLVVSTLEMGDPRKEGGNRGWMTLSDDYVWPWSGHDHYGMTEPARDKQFGDAVNALIKKIQCSHVTTAIRMSLAIVKAIEAQTGRMRGHVLVQYQTTPNCHLRQYYCVACPAYLTYVENDPGAIMDGELCPNACGGTLQRLGVATYTCVNGHRFVAPELPPFGRGRSKCGCGGAAVAYVGASERLFSHSSSRGSKAIPGLPSPSCGFPLGVFWNFAGDATLWAHEMGHNRHYEHSADAMQDPRNSARPQHDKEDNALITHGDEKPDNKGWDRACLMSYVSQVKDTKNKATYDKERDAPCFCFKCVLKNRGWRVGALPTPKGDLQDVKGV
jgi:hypothetical protein